MHDFFEAVGTIYFVGCLFSFLEANRLSSDSLIYALIWPVRLVKRAKETLNE